MFLTRLLRAVTAAFLVSLAAATPSLGFAQASAPAAPAATAAPTAPAVTTTKETVENPYGLEALWRQGDIVARGTLIIMIIMSIGSWYIIFTKVWEQSRIIRSSRAVGDGF